MALDSGDATTVNVPLPAGSGDDDYLRIFDRVVEPAVREFEPDLLLVSAGFDAHVDDPLADMRVTADGFRAMAARCATLAPRVAAVLEGGYNLHTLPGLVEAALEGFEREVRSPWAHRKEPAGCGRSRASTGGRRASVRHAKEGRVGEPWVPPPQRRPGCGPAVRCGIHPRSS